MKQTYRNGDLSITPTTKIEGEKIEHNGSIILALGEQTGHKHVITVPERDKLTAYKTKEGDWVLVLGMAGTITHEEHKTIEIPAGTYYVGREREKDHFSNFVRRVVD